jgi:Zn-dependent M28 family amino/carboxypeptidase
MRISSIRPLVVLTAVATGVQPLRAQASAPGQALITAEKLRADLFFLSGDGFRGRLTNTPENDLALEWVKSRFQALGLKPIGPIDSYFMPFNLVTASLGDGNQIGAAWAGTTGITSFSMGADFFPHRFSASARVTAPVVFAGFGISAPQLGYDDLPADAVRGKIVLALDHEPGENDSTSRFDGVVFSEYGVQIKKALAAQARGAAGILFVSDIHNHPGVETFEVTSKLYWPEKLRIERYHLGRWADQVRIPAAQISVAMADQLLRATGKTLGELARAAETTRGSLPVTLPGIELTFSTAVARHLVRDRNVVAALEGSDPALRQEWIVISGHPDHDGADGTQIWNGADDNGSGTVGLVAIAEAFAAAAARGERPKRSILFASFNSEERGLLGAWAFAEMPLVPLEKIVAVLNMDMIGRNEEVQEGGGLRFRGLPLQTAESNNNSVTLLGWSRSAALTGAVERANEAYGLTLKKTYDNNVSNLIRRSDHWPFLQHGVPGIWFHTGLHPDYHTVYDRPEKINYPKMEKIARLVHQVAWNLAQSGTRPRLNADGAR